MKTISLLNLKGRVVKSFSLKEVLLLGYFIDFMKKSRYTVISGCGKRFKNCLKEESIWHLQAQWSVIC